MRFAPMFHVKHWRKPATPIDSVVIGWYDDMAGAVAEPPPLDAPLLMPIRSLPSAISPVDGS